MKTKLAFLLGIALWAFGAGRSAVVSAQTGTLQQRLAKTTALECHFTAYTRAEWQEGVAGTSTDAKVLDARYSAVNVEEGSAQADSRYGTSYIVVRYSHDYLHLMQISDVGPLFVTTVIAQETIDGRMKAIHTRHNYAASSYPEFAERPEMYVGDCAVEN